MAREEQKAPGAATSIYHTNEGMGMRGGIGTYVWIITLITFVTGCVVHAPREPIIAGSWASPESLEVGPPVDQARDDRFTSPEYLRSERVLWWFLGILGGLVIWGLLNSNQVIDGSNTNTSPAPCGSGPPPPPGSRTTCPF